jgi:hypothetical protein
VLPGEGFEAALFVGPDQATLLEGTPVADDLVASGETDLTVDGLTDGQMLHVALGLRADGSTTYAAAGPSWTVVPGAPLYVDAAADPNVADGLSPQTAFPDLGVALIQALFRGGANVWVRGGTYELGAASVFPNTFVYGGFEADFDLEDRNLTTTRLLGAAGQGQQVLAMAGGIQVSVLDGLVLDGRNNFAIGIDVENTPVEIRATKVSGFTGRGVRIRNSSDSDLQTALLAASRFDANGGDGVSVAGPYVLQVDSCTFDNNVQEGLDLDDLIAPGGETARLEVQGSRFFGNGAEGLDADLATPLVPGTTGGRFRVLIRGCRFERNVLAGLLIDSDYEQTPGWKADVIVRDSLARANLGAGISFDADDLMTIAVDGVSATANGGDGVLVTSEVTPGLVTVSSSVLAGNVGAGVRAKAGPTTPRAEKTVAASHCVFAGNALGGLVSEVVEATATSCITYLQPNPAANTRRFGCPDVADPAVPVFRYAPIGWLPISSIDGAALTLATAPVGLSVGDAVEVGDDGALRRVAAVAGSVVTLDAAPAITIAPTTLAVYPAAATFVVEDYDLAAGSAVLGQGYALPGSDPVDPGFDGAPVDVDPGFALVPDTARFACRDVLPAPSVEVDRNATLVLVFSDPVDPTSLGSTAIRLVGDDGTAIQATISVDQETLRLSPPSRGFPRPGMRVEIGEALRDISGRPLANPLVLSLTIR